MTTPPPPPTTEIALLRSELLLLLADIKSDIRLTLQRLEQGEARTAEQERTDREHDSRISRIEQTYVTRADMDEKSRRTIQIIALIAGLFGTAAGVLTSIIIAIAQ